MVTNGKESRDTDSGGVEDDLRSTLVYLTISSAVFPYGDSKCSMLLERIGIAFSPTSEVEWAELVSETTSSETFPECVFRVDSRNSEIPTL